MTRRAPEIQKFMDNYAIGEQMAAERGDEVGEWVREMFESKGLGAMYEEMLAGLIADGHNPNNPVSWQAALHGSRHMGTRQQVEQRMRRRG